MSKLPRMTVRDQVQSVASVIESLEEQSETNVYSLSLEFALTELIRGEMRSIVQSAMTGYRHDDLLRMATDHVREAIDQTCRVPDRAANRLEGYLNTVLEKLKASAREMEKLAIELIDSKNKQKLGTTNDREIESGHGFVVHEIGLRDSIAGLLLKPDDGYQTVNIEALQGESGCTVTGEWFPFEVSIEDFVFVIDDDGSIFVSTANLPASLREQAHRMITRVAELVLG